MTSINKITSTNNVKNISFKSIDKNTKDATDINEQAQTEQSVVNPLYYQSINGIKTSSINKKALEQSRFYNKENYIPHTEKIVDGFKDGGSSSEILDNGSVVGGIREVIVIDRTKDEKLQEIIKDFKEHIKTVDTDFETYSEVTKKYVFNNFVKNIEKEEIEYEIGKEVLLGDILNDSKPVCRHVALLYKILADEIGLEADYIRGEFHYGDIVGMHAWLKVHEDGCTSICDPSNNVETAQCDVRFMQKDGTIIRGKYIMPEGLKDEFDE